MDRAETVVTDLRQVEPKAGDVLLFAGSPGSPLGEAIMWLTGSPISHAALVDDDGVHLVDAVPPHVRRVKIAEAAAGRKVWMRRLRSRPSNMGPVTAEARRHLTAVTDYAETDLVLLAFLLLHRKLPLSGRVQNLGLRFFRRVTRRVSERLTRITEGEGASVVCSQFVYACHEVAGRRYRLDLRGHRLGTEEASFGRDADALESPGRSGPSGPTADQPLLELSIEAIEDEGTAGLRQRAGAETPLDDDPTTTADDERLVRELLDALREAEADAAPEETRRRGTRSANTAEAADFEVGDFEVGDFGVGDVEMDGAAAARRPTLEAGLVLAIQDFAQVLARQEGESPADDDAAGDSLEAASFSIDGAPGTGSSTRSSARSDTGRDDGAQALRRLRDPGPAGSRAAAASRSAGAPSETFFVTPGDLLDRVENLETLAVLELP